MFENRELKKIFGPKTDKVTGEWRRLHDQELHNFYRSVNQMKDDETDGRVACMGEKRNANRILVVKPEGKRPFGRSTRRWGGKLKAIFEKYGGLRRRSAAAHLLVFRVRIPREAWMSVSCGCCVLSGRGLCDGLITRPEES